MIVRPHDGLGSARGRHDEVGDGAEAEEHEAAMAVLGGEVAERDVRAIADEVQVADDGQPWRRQGRDDGVLLLLLRLARCLLLIIVAATTTSQQQQQQHERSYKQQHC